MDWLRDLAGALRFFSRLPVPGAAEPFDFQRSLRLAPLAGAALGLAGGLVFAAALALHAPPAAAALLALGFGAFITGALHEDGLADVADGFGGGVTRERKLEIMKDSRIGAFGAVALIVSFGLRASALATLAAAPLSGVLALAAAGALSRCACLAPLVLLPPARSDGSGRAASGQADGMRPAFLLVLPLAFLPALGDFGLSTCFTALALAGVATLGLCAWARAQIGGQTGDVAGAAQQVAEIAALLVYSAASAA